MAIADLSNNLVFRLHGRQRSFGGITESFHLLNHRLITALAETGIEIPFPVTALTTQLHRQRQESPEQPMISASRHFLAAADDWESAPSVVNVFNA
jgi:hypothetical protein